MSRPHRADPTATAPADDPAGPAPARPTAGRRANVAALEAMYQLVLWLIPVLDGLPRSHKFQLGDRLQSTAMDVLDTLVEAAYTRQRRDLLQRANLGLEKLRYWVRLAHDLKLLDFRRYEHAARQIDDVGRQVGGWLRAERASDHAPPA